MSETGSDPGETPPTPAPAADAPAGRAEIIRRSLEAMNDDNVRRVRNIYVPGAVSPEVNGTAGADEPQPGEPSDEPTA